MDMMNVVVAAVPQYLDAAQLPQFSEVYITPGKPAFECCDAVVVWGGKVGQARTNQPNLNGGRVVNVTVPAFMFTITILECVPTISEVNGQPPSLAQYAADAQRVYDRAGAIYSGLLCDATARTLWAGTATGQSTAETTIGELIWDPPSGACLPARITITSQLQKLP